jgi:hypothetical protein
MTDEHFTEDDPERKRIALARERVAENRRTERERKDVFIPVLVAAQRLMIARARLKSEDGLHWIGTLSEEFMAEMELISAMRNFKYPEYPKPEYSE